jgi:hypothetical protein
MVYSESWRVSMEDIPVATTEDVTGLLGGKTPSYLYEGYNSVTGLGQANAAVEGGSAADDAKPEARSGVRCNVSLNIEELATALDVNQSLSVGYGVASADAKISLMERQKLTTYSLSISVYAWKYVENTSARDVVFKPDIELPKTDKAANQFVRYHGDSYLSSVTKGGEYIGIFTSYCSSYEQQRYLWGEFSSSYASAFDASSETQAAFSSFMKKVDVEYYNDQLISGLSNPVYPAPVDFILYGSQFPSKEMDAPVIVTFQKSGYETVPGSGNAFDKVAKNRTYFTGNTLVGGLTEDLICIYESHNQMTQLNKIYSFYSYSGDEVLLKNLQQAQADINAIESQMSLYSSEATFAFPELPLPSNSIGTPKLRYTQISTPSWGGSGGQPFNDVDITTYFQNRTRIHSIGLRSGARVDQLRTGYLSKLDSQPICMTHGGYGGGSDQGDITLPEGCLVTSVSGRAGAGVDQLTIDTDQLSISGGGKGGHAFGPWTPSEAGPGAIVLGFRGRSGSELDQIGVVCARLEPATWNPRS